MFTKIGTIGVGVSNQDKALEFYVNKLGFEKIDDQPMSETERWLEVALPGAQTHIMLGLRGQMGGDKTGFTGYILNTDNIEETCATLKARGVTITKEPIDLLFSRTAENPLFVCHQVAIMVGLEMHATTRCASQIGETDLSRARSTSKASVAHR